MGDGGDRLQIGEFAELVGLSIPQLRRYDRLRLLTPAARSESGYRYYSRGQTGAARVIALLRSMDMPLADVRRVLAGADEAERRELLRVHRARLEARLEEVLSLLEAVDAMIKEETVTIEANTELSSWLHVMPRVPVSDMERSIAYYQESDVVDPVASRPNGMRDFVVRDPDGHRFTLGRGEEQRLRDVADHYGLTSDEISVKPEWLTPSIGTASSEKQRARAAVRPRIRASSRRA